MPNSGYIAYTNLEEYYLDNGVSTGNTTTNSPTNANYVPPSYDANQ